MAKVNFGTVLKRAYVEANRDKLAETREAMNPRRVLGMGSGKDTLGSGPGSRKAQGQSGFVSLWFG